MENEIKGIFKYEIKAPSILFDKNFSDAFNFLNITSASINEIDVNTVTNFNPIIIDNRVERVKAEYGLLQEEAEMFISLNDNVKFKFKEFIPLIKALPKSYHSGQEIPVQRLLDSVQWFYLVSKTIEKTRKNQTRFDNARLQRFNQLIRKTQFNLIKKILCKKPDYIVPEELSVYYKFYGMTSPIPKTLFDINTQSMLY
jgi:hypothetical protein